MKILSSRRRQTFPAFLISLLVFVFIFAPSEVNSDLESQLDLIKLPLGFQIRIYADNVPNARSMTLSPNGTLFVGTRDAGKVYAILDRDKDNRADEVITIAQGLYMPNGVAFRDNALYVAEVNRVLRYDNIEDTLTKPPPPVVVNDSFPKDWHHGWKFIGFGPDDMLYIPVGAPCNVCDPADPIYATIMRMGVQSLLFSVALQLQVDLDDGDISSELRGAFADDGIQLSRNVSRLVEKKDSRWRIIDKNNRQTYTVKKEVGKLNIYLGATPSLEFFAHGVRNTVGFDWHPETKELWFTDNGRDEMGDDLPPDELNHARKRGLHFGFPYRHGKDIPDPEFAKRRSGRKLTPPALELGPHVAALGMRFYTGTMFPDAYRNQIFIAEHGSWNRSKKIGYRITLVRFKKRRPETYEVFAEGWLQGENEWGRPVDALVMPDGALLVSDDHAGAIYRISYISAIDNQ